MSILLVFIILSILVLIHEFGHFIVAKKNDVYVEEFGFGLPPRLFGLKIGETLYSFNLLPFGGFVKVLGEEEAEIKEKTIPKELEKRTFTRKKPIQKALIVMAGVIANFILGWVIISYLFTKGVPVPTNNVIVENVVKNSPAEAAGLKPNDIIQSITVGKNQYSLKTSNQLIQLTKKYAGQSMFLTVTRDKKQLKTSIIPRKDPPKGEGPLGIIITSFSEKKYPWYQAPFFGLIEAMKITQAIIMELLKMFFRLFTFQKIGVDVTGPIGIAQITSKAMKFGTSAVLQLLGLLSLNLAVVNILPFPSLDGGRLSLIIYEWISKKKVNPSFEKRLNLIGFVVLLSLIFLVTINDLMKLIKP